MEMNERFRKWLISYIFLMSYGLIDPTMGDPRMQLVFKQCGKLRAQNVSQFNENYSNVIGSMQTGILANKFATGKAGERPNRVYVLAQCMEDLSVADCAACVSSIETQIPGCLPRVSARVYFDGCFIRMENYSFFEESFSSYDLESRCSDAKIAQKQAFRSVVTRLMEELVEKAPVNGGYAHGYETTDGKLTAYGLANCWRTLDKSSCSECLTNASIGILGCLPSIEARVLHVGCYLRYSDSEFINEPEWSSSREAIFLFLAAILGAVLMCLAAILVGYFVSITIYERRNTVNKQKEMQIGSDAISRSWHFKYSTLEKATDNFNDSHKIGQGGYGEVFKGTLQDGREIAVKHMFVSGKAQNQEISNEIDIIGQARHQNLVLFLGCCFTCTDGFLVYEFLPNKSLDLMLFDQERKKELTWKKRLGIIKGTAEGLQYMHEHCQVQIIHRDIKASNILLDTRLRPKIADFGLAKLSSCSTNQTEGVPTIAGTFGYMAPEYLIEGRLTEKVDVYSYGVLVLEIICGVQNNKFESDGSLDTLVTVAWKHYKTECVSRIIDSSLELENSNEAQRIIEIALLCTQESPDLRPSMGEVIEFLDKKELVLPVPSKPPFLEEL